jgi:alginate O-acetyltransferase complex protein AlgI
MAFLSMPFALFLGLVVAAFQLSPARWRPLVLLGASYAFYATWSPGYTLLLLGATLVAHQAALGVESRQTEAGKLRLAATAVAALALLLVGFKIARPIADWSTASSGVGSGGPALRILLPLGLSYYLFKLIGYVLDVHWETIRAERSLSRVALYASFFPQIVSGPIQRAGDFFDQLGRLDAPDPASVTAGLRRILLGLVKKLVIADRLAVLVDGVHARPGSFSSLELLLGAYLFAIQLYADFSGVTDIAIGLGQLLGIKGPENFDLPFLSRNVQEYWRRWHMSLTSWLVDYLFTPLRMALRNLGGFGLGLAILVNMLAIGLWHGVTWTYAMFGLLNGVYMVMSVFTSKRRDAFFGAHPVLANLRVVTGPIVTFHLVVLSLVLFRAESVASATTYLARLVPGLGSPGVPSMRLDFRLLQVSPKGLLVILGLYAATEFVNWAMRRPEWERRFEGSPRAYRWGFYYATILLTLALSHLGEQQFIYAQF